MCQILFSEKANPPAEVLRYANSNNRDGFGYAYVNDDGKVVFKKGFDHTALDGRFIDMYHSLPFPKAIHFRLATHGGISKELTHPFPIKRGVPLTLDGVADSVLFHNGVWHAWDDRLRDGILGGTLNPNILRQPMSDSRAMAILAQRFGAEIFDILTMGTNKILILSGGTWVKYGDWTKREGWSASSSRVDPPSHDTTKSSYTGTYNSGSGTSWEPSGSKHDRNWRIVDKRRRKGRERVDATTPCGNPPSGLSGNVTSIIDRQKSLYLDATREEIEEEERAWRTRYMHNG